MANFYDESRPRICLIPIPSFPRLTEKKREAGIYISGGLFALGWWFFIDSVVYSNYLRQDDNGVPVINFEDWMCGILSTLGMLIINSIDKSRLMADTYTYGEGTTRDRLFLFVGFAALAGGLAGSFTILILKYIVADPEMPHLYFGIALIIQNLSIMLSSFTLWIAQNTENENNHYLY